MSQELHELALDQVHDSPDQPRLNMSAEVRASVKAGINGNGGAYPAGMAITVRPRPAGGFEILVGHHRAQAARELGTATIWAFVREMNDRDAKMLMVASNSQRGMSPVEIGRHALKMRDQHGVTVVEYAKAIGKSESGIYAYIKAWQVLEQYGGIKGMFAAVPAQALTALHGVPDQGFVSGLLFQFRERGTTGPIAEKVVKHCKEGRPMWQAFNLAEGKDDPAVDATPEKLTHPRVGNNSGSGYHRGTGAAKNQTAGFSAVAVIHQNEALITAYEFTLALYQARCEELEARFGDQVAGVARDAFNDQVAMRQQVILAELRAEREQTEVPA